MCGTHRFRCAVYGHTQPNRNDKKGVIMSWQDLEEVCGESRNPATSPLVTSRRTPQSNDLSPWAARVRPVALDHRTSGALSSFARSCRGNGGGRVTAPVKKSTILDPPIDTRELLLSPSSDRHLSKNT